MTIIEWLLEEDIVIQYLANKYLLERPAGHKDGGYIGRYLGLYDREEEKWGGSIYTRKWICNTYTLLELKYTEIRYDDPCCQGAAGMVMDDLWKCHGRISKARYQDMCMSAVVLSTICYARMEDERIYEIIDYILGHQMKDGGWNCAWDSVHNCFLVGSVHTTLSVLEALADYKRYGYGYRLKEIKDQAALGQEYLLRRELFKSLSTGEPIHQDMVHFHYPCRWKYDCFRALEYSTRIGYPYNGRMKDALDKVKAELQKGYINKGRSYAGKVHFPPETGTKGRFDTFRGMFILRCYDKDAYDNIAGLKFSYG